MRNIVVAPYDESWPGEFEKIRGELVTALADSILAVEHVGSTSVPGLWAKPVIDLDLVIEEGQFEIVRERLAELGYSHEGDQGITGREVFKYEDKPHLMKHHLYVCASNSEELGRHLAFRDYLRSHPTDRDRLCRPKTGIGRKIPARH